MSEESTIYTLKKPFDFEGETVTEIDTSVLENLTRKDIKTAVKLFNASKDKEPGAVPFLDFDYNLNVLAIALGQPSEYFENIGGADYQSLATKVMGFLNN